MKMKMKTQQEQKKVKQGERIRTWKLKGDNAENYRQEMEKLMQETKDITWENLKTGMLNTAKKICGVTRGQKRPERDSWWWSEEVQLAVKNKKEAFKRWQVNRLDADFRKAYKIASKETKKSVAKAKSISVQHLYEELSTKEGEAKIYKIAKTRQRNRMDKQAVNMIKDKNGKILTDEEAIKDRWKLYFDELLNMENTRDTLEEEDTTEGPEHEITRTEIEQALGQMRNNKAPGPSGITAEMFKAMDKESVEWLFVILNDFMRSERLPDDLKISEIVTIFKQKGDAMECGNYRGIKLLEIGLKVYERVIERRIRQQVTIQDNQFGFMKGRGTTDAIFILRQSQEKVLEGNERRYWTFVDLEKAFDRVPREVIYWSLRKKGTTEKIVRLIKSMYEGTRTSVRCKVGKTAELEIKVGLHQGSCLSPLLFIIVMDAVSENIKREVPWDMLYADDLIIADRTTTGAQTRFTEWQKELESKGLKVNTSKTETMVCSKTEEALVIVDREGNTLKQVEDFKYLGSVMHNTGGCEQDVKNKIKSAWQKWRDLTGVICDPKITVALKGKIYKTMIRPVMMYGAEAWTLRRKEEKLLERTEMRMLRWILGITLKDMQRNENIRIRIGVVCITDKIREARLRWYGHVERSGDTSIRRAMKLEVQGLRSRGRQKKRWMDMIQEDLKSLNLKPEDTGRRDMWRQRIRVADPSPARD